MCRGGAENLCLNGELMGFDHPGAYAERVVIPNIALKNLFRIPDGLSPAHATFADPLSDVICGHKDIGDRPRRRRRRDRRRPGRHRARRAGAAAGRRPGAAARAHRAAGSSSRAAILGDDRVAYLDTEDADGVAAVSRATDGFGADVVIVACSSDIAQQEAMEMAAPRGRVLFFGGLPKGTTHIQFPSNVLHYKEVQVHGSYASRHRDQVRGARHAGRRRGRHPLRGLGRRSALDETPDAFPRIRAGEALKVVVAP